MNTRDDEYAAELREFARSLFADDEDETDETDGNSKPPGNFVRREGNNPKPPPEDDMAMREFARELFDRE